ncbi:MAG: DUF4270 domain-containing protein [Parafilimonas sp.]
MNLFLRRFTFFLFFITVFFACTKIITTDIGSGLLPPADGVTTKDTVLDIVTKNTGYDTAYVGISDDHVLGFMNDPVFGKTTASVNFQVAPPYSSFSWGYPKENIILDSVVLCLSYKNVWGDSTQPLRLHVYSMDPEVLFKADSAYNNTKTFEKGQELTEFNTAKEIYPTTLNDVDTTKGFYTEPVTNQLRIKLNNSFGQQLINYDSAQVYQNDSTFYNYVRGLIVEPEETTGNSLLQINLLDTLTRLTVYYHTKDGLDTASRRFSPNVLTSASSNTIFRNYSGTQIPSYIASANTNDDLIFMQTTPGLHTSIDISSVLSMPNVIVHRAEILMYQVPDASDQYLTPPNLFLDAYSKDSMRNFAIPYDLSFTGSAFGNLAQFGVAPKLKNGSYYYSFDITRYTQSIVTRNDTLYKLNLFAPYNQNIYPIQQTIYTVPISSPALNTVGVGRIRLGGGNNPQYKMRLHIVYSLP